MSENRFNYIAFQRPKQLRFEDPRIDGLVMSAATWGASKMLTDVYVALHDQLTAVGRREMKAMIDEISEVSLNVSNKIKERK